MDLKNILIEGENIIYKAKKDSLILTNNNIISIFKKGGEYKYTKIPLEMISSFEIHKRIKWIFFILFVGAILTWGIAEFAYDNERFRMFIIKAVTMVILFAVTLKKSLRIHSKEGSKVNVLLKDLEDKDAHDLIREIEIQKEKRIEKVQK